VELQLQKKPEGSERVVQLGVLVAIKQMYKNFSLLCKEVRVMPREIVVNQTQQLLTVRQDGELADRLFEPNERQILEHRKGRDRKLVFKLPET